MINSRTALLCAAALTSFGAAPASAAILVGSWTVDQGPGWSQVPPAYTAQEAAALLFGGSPSDYMISTQSDTVNHFAWVSTWGGDCGGASPCGSLVAEDFKIATNGLYQSPGDTSAYVNDWATGATYTNYAFLPGDGVPEASTWTMLIAGIGLAGAALRRRPVVTVRLAL